MQLPTVLLISIIWITVVFASGASVASVNALYSPRVQNLKYKITKTTIGLQWVRMHDGYSFNKHENRNYFSI